MKYEKFKSIEKPLDQIGISRDVQFKIISTIFKSDSMSWINEKEKRINPEEKARLLIQEVKFFFPWNKKKFAIKIQEKIIKALSDNYINSEYQNEILKHLKK